MAEEELPFILTGGFLGPTSRQSRPWSPERGHEASRVGAPELHQVLFPNSLKCHFASLSGGQNQVQSWLLQTRTILTNSHFHRSATVSRNVFNAPNAAYFSINLSFRSIVQKYLVACWIWSQIVGIEGNDVDHYTTTTASFSRNVAIVFSVASR